jgi:hypothetical protein
MSATCRQTRLSRRTGLPVSRYLPHVVPDSSDDGYAHCEECGRTVYVGQGHGSPQAMQAAEARGARWGHEE